MNDPQLRALHAEMDAPGSHLAKVRALAPFIGEQRRGIEQDRRLPAALVESMREAGFFSLWLPRPLGGPEVHPRELVAVIMELARADGSAGWCAGIASVCGLLAPGLPPSVAKDVFGGGHIVAGSINPTGKAQVVPGGYRLSGRWSYGSAVDFADWMILGCIAHENDAPRRSAAGAPDIRFLFLPRDALTVIDTWKVSGLRGTGSHDITVTDLFVPDERSLPGFQATGGDSTLYRIPLISLFATALAAIALGILQAPPSIL